MMTTARDALAVRLAGAAADAAPDERSEELERLVTQLFEDLGRPVLRYIRGFVRDGVVARDLTQEVFVRLCAELRAGRGVTDARAWLFRVAHNLAIDEQRRSRVRESASPTPTADAADEARRLRHGLDRAARSLLELRQPPAQPQP